MSNVGLGNGERWLRRLHGSGWAEFRRRLAMDRVRRVLTGESERVHSHDVMVPDPLTRKVREERQKSVPGWDMTILLESADAIIEFRPEDGVERIAPRAIQWIHAAEDALVPAEESRRMFQRAGAPKDLVILEGLGHYDTYQGAGFEAMTSAAISWFRRHL